MYGFEPQWLNALVCIKDALEQATAQTSLAVIFTFSSNSRTRRWRVTVRPFKDKSEHFHKYRVEFVIIKSLTNALVQSRSREFSFFSRRWR